MAKVSYIQQRVNKDKEEEKKKKTQQRGKPSDFLVNRAKGSQPTQFNAQGARVDGIKAAEVQIQAYKKAQAGASPVLPSRGTVNPTLGPMVSKRSMKRDLKQMGSKMKMAQPLGSVDTGQPRPTGGTANPSLGYKTEKRPTMVAVRVNPTIEWKNAEQPKATAGETKAKVIINLDGAPVENRATVNPSFGGGMWKAKPRRSTAKDRKTMLYETNDSLLSDDELIEKYRLVTEDQDMDADLRDKAAKKGSDALIRVSKNNNIFSKNGDAASKQQRLEEVMELEGKLFFMSRKHAFMEGYAGGFGGNPYTKAREKALRTTDDQALKKEIIKEQADSAKTIQAYQGTSMAGRVTAESAKNAMALIFLAPAIESGMASVAGKAASSTRPIVQSAYNAYQNSNKVQKGVRFGADILGQQAIDTAVNTPTTIIDGMGNGKTKDEIMNDVLKQQVFDLGFNVGMGGLEVAAKAAKYKSAIKKNKQNISEQIAKSMTGEMDSNTYIKLGETPEILKKHGMKSGQMMIPQTVIPKIAYPAEYRQSLAMGSDISGSNIKKIQGHNLGFEVIRQLPERLKNPVAILKSDTHEGSIVVLTDMIDTYGQPIIVPIRVQKDGVTEFGNVIPSAYGRQGFVEFINRQQDEGNLLYLDKKRNLQELPNNGVQFPESFTNADPMSSLLNKNGKVNRKEAKKIEKELQNITKGNEHEMLEKALREEQEGILNAKRAEGVAPSNAKSPPETSKTAMQPTLNDSLLKNSEEINSDVAKHGAGEVLPTGSKFKAVKGEAAEISAEATRNFLTKEDRKALGKEYKTLSFKKMNDEYLRIKNDRGMDGGEEKAAAYATDFFKRKAEIEEILAPTTKAELARMKQVKNQGIAEMKKLISFKGSAAKKEALEILKGAEEELKIYGHYTKETKDRLFKTLLAQGVESNKGSIDTELKAYLRKATISISREDAHNIADFDLLRKSLHGKIKKISNKGEGLPVDIMYKELQELFPQQFPEGIVHPADQMRHIAEVAESLKIRDTPILKNMGAEEIKGMRQEFDGILSSIEEKSLLHDQIAKENKARKMRAVIRSSYDIDPKELSIDDMKDLHNMKYTYEKTLDGVNRRSPLTTNEKLLVQQLHRGEIGWEDIRKLPLGSQKDRMEKMAEVYEAERNANKVKKAIGDHKALMAAERRQKIADAVGDLTLRKDGKKGWKDAARIWQARTTQERILEEVAPDAETAKRITEVVFEPIHIAARDKEHFIKELMTSVRKLKISTKKNIVFKGANDQKHKMSESGLVQFLGEKRFKLQQLEAKGQRITQEDTEIINVLRQEVTAAEGAVSKEQLQKVEDGIQTIQRIYKKIHSEINEVLIRNGYDPIGYIEGYFPHMMFDDPTDPLGMVMQKLGMEISYKELPMDIAGRTETRRPGKKFVGNFLERTGDTTDYDALRGLDTYLDSVGDVIYQTENIRNLRAYTDYIRNSTSPKGLAERKAAIRQDMSLNTDEMNDLLNSLNEDGAKNVKLQNYVSNLDDFTNLLAGKQSAIDRAFENNLIGRPIYTAVNAIESRVAANMVAGNIGSALTNVIPLTQGLSPMSVKNNLRGLQESLVNMTKGELDDLAGESAFLTTRQSGEKLYKTGLQKATDIAIKPMEWVDKFSTNAVYRSRFHHNLEKGMTRQGAIREADNYARRLFAGRSQGAMPTAFHSKTLKPLTMFQLEVNNQLDFLLKDLPKEAHGNAYKALNIYTGVFVSALIYNDVYEKITGRRAALDPIDYANQAIKGFTGTGLRNSVDIVGDVARGNGLQMFEQKEKPKPGDVLANLTKDIGGNVPFVGGLVFDGGRIPLQSAVPRFDKAIMDGISAMNGDSTWKKAGNTFGKEVIDPLLYSVPPFGGGQLKKTARGLETMVKGGSYNVTKEGEQLQFAVDKNDPKAWAQAAIFGKWALPQGQAYLNGEKALGTKQTGVYEKLKEVGVDNEYSKMLLSKISLTEKIEGKRQALRDATMDIKSKAIIYKEILASDTDKEVMDTLARMGSDEGKIYDCLNQLAETGDDTRKQRIILNSDLSTQEKKYIHTKKVSSEDGKKIQTFGYEGMDINDFLRVKCELYAANKRSLPTKEKRAIFVDKVLDMGFTREQRELIYEEFNIAKKYRV